MGNVIDITGKLTGGENPRMKVREAELEVKADARTVLSIMNLMGAETPTNRDVLRCLDLLLSPEDRARLDGLDLSFRDYMTVIREAMTLASGAGEEMPGEGETRTTT